MDNAKLAYWMVKKKVTPTHLAEKVGVSQAYISQIRSGHRIGSVSIWGKIAEALEIELKELC